MSWMDQPRPKSGELWYDGLRDEYTCVTCGLTGKRAAFTVDVRTNKPHHLPCKEPLGAKAPT